LRGKAKFSIGGQSISVEFIRNHHRDLGMHVVLSSAEWLFARICWKSCILDCRMDMGYILGIP